MTDRIHLFAYGAEQEDIARGEAAIRAHFEAAGTTPMQAAVAGHDFEFEELSGGENLESPRREWAFAWMDALSVGVKAALGDAQRPWFTDLIVRPADAQHEFSNDECTAEIDWLMSMSDEELERECEEAHEAQTLRGLLPLHVASHRASQRLPA
jgi:hypothetical protein